MPNKEFRKWRRIHGLQLPLHPQQLLAWAFLFSFTLYMFLALIPAMHSAYHLPLLAINGVIFGLHYARCKDYLIKTAPDRPFPHSHLTALLLDPSDPALLALYSKKVK